MSGQFQSSVNVFNPIGYPGEIAFSGPMRVEEYNIYSAGVPNVFGYAYTQSAGGSPTPSGDSPLAQNAQVGGTGIFAGILVGRKEAVLSGTAAGGPLAASLALLDYAEGSLMKMGYCFASLPGPANVGDLVTFDPATGALNSITPKTVFTGSIAAGGAATLDVLTVTALTSGQIAVGQLITGTGIAGGTYIVSLGTGLGKTGTYNVSTVNLQTVSSTTITTDNVPAAAFSGTATFATNVMTVATVVSGQFRVGDQVFGAGVPANTVITALGTGVGGTGTYTLNQTVGTITPAIAVTGPANVLIPRCVVEEFTANALGGVAVLKLTN